MSEEIIYRPPLAIHFESRMLSELDVVGNQLVFSASHQPTELPKSGFQALLAKTPLADDAPVAMDIDLSCGLYDDTGKLLEVVWYGNVRNFYQSIRHHGDTFVGMNKAYRPSMIEETISIRIWELEQDIHRVALFVHSHHKQPLNKAVDGHIFLNDSDGKLIHETPFASFTDDVYAVCAWQLVKMRDGDWRLSAPMSVIKAKNSGEIAKNWHGLGD